MSSIKHPKNRGQKNVVFVYRSEVVENYLKNRGFEREVSDKTIVLVLEERRKEFKERHGNVIVVSLLENADEQQLQNTYIHILQHLNIFDHETHDFKVNADQGVAHPSERLVQRSVREH